MTTTKFEFYNAGIKKQNPAYNINLFANKFQDMGNPESPLNPLDEAQLKEVFTVLRRCIIDAHFLAFPGEQKALINHILECLNEDLKDYLGTIKKAALSTDESDWEKMEKVMTEAYNEY